MRPRRWLPWSNWYAATSTKVTKVGEVRLTGRPASPGLALSRLFVLSEGDKASARRQAGDPDSETARLRAAIATAVEELEEVSAHAAPDARDILEFQVAMLGDEALAEAAFATIA